MQVHGTTYPAAASLTVSHAALTEGSELPLPTCLLLPALPQGIAAGGHRGLQIARMTEEGLNYMCCMHRKVGLPMLYAFGRSWA